MMPDEIVVLDASAGVKWFKNEPGSTEARQLLAQHRSGGIRLAVAAHFQHELVSVAIRERGLEFGSGVWVRLKESDLTVVDLDELADEAFSQCVALGCTFSDALAPALAKLVGGTLVSADRRAHGAFAGVRLIGQDRT